MYIFLQIFALSSNIRLFYVQYRGVLIVFVDLRKCGKNIKFIYNLKKIINFHWKHYSDTKEPPNCIFICSVIILCTDITCATQRWKGSCTEDG